MLNHFYVKYKGDGNLGINAVIDVPDSHITKVENYIFHLGSTADKGDVIAFGRSELMPVAQVIDTEIYRNEKRDIFLFQGNSEEITKLMAYAARDYAALLKEVIELGKD